MLDAVVAGRRAAPWALAWPGHRRQRRHLVRDYGAALLARANRPSITDDRGLPKDEHSLAIAASRWWILSFDNLSGITSFLVTCCAVSQAVASQIGPSILTPRKRRSSFSAALLGERYRRPRRAARLRRQVHKRPAVADQVRRTEAEIGEEYERERPALLGCLLDALAHAMAAPKLTADLPRMADFAVLAMKGCAPSLGRP